MGGWRIIRTMGHKLVKLAPVNGFAAETAAGTVIEIATRFGIPISTTHAISGSILGVGIVRGPRTVGWQVAGNMVTAWILTIPVCFALGFLIMSALAAIAGLGVSIPGLS
jgi:PiT family inorganic phosphate transporter